MSWNIAASAQNSNKRWFWQPPAALQQGRLLLAALAGLALWLTELPSWLLLLLLLLIVVDASFSLGCWLQHRQASRRNGLVQLEKQWWYWRAQQGWQPVKLLPNSLVWSWLVVLELQPTFGRRRYLVVPWYLLPREEFRRLRVALRFSSL